MKRVMVLATLVVAVSLAVAPSATLAEEQNADEISRYCSTHGDLGLSHGACVAYFTSHNIVPHDASICQDPGIRAFLGVTNPGQCVVKLREMRQ